MYVLVVTGGIGAGKTTATEFFHSKGAVVLPLDELAKRHLEPDTKVFTQVVERFGEGILGDDGRIDPEALAREAFASRECAAKLNEIVHPAVLREVAPGLTDMGLLPSPPQSVVLDVPLLVEAPAFAELGDTVLAISAPEEERVRRMVDRGMAEDDVRARMACQASDAEREAMADHVIVNDGTLDEFHSSLERFWDEVIVDAP